MEQLLLLSMTLDLDPRVGGDRIGLDPAEHLGVGTLRWLKLENVENGGL